jgi:hypothetical protein
MPFKNIEDAKACSKKYYLNNKENIKNKIKLFYLNNKEKLKEKNKLYYLNNKEKRKRYNIKYRLKNRNLLNAIAAKRRASKLKATPKFANLNKIKEIYLKCPAGYHVDHIIPLQGENVCGLHVEWNLQYLTPSANISKSNKLIC